MDKNEQIVLNEVWNFDGSWTNLRAAVAKNMTEFQQQTIALEGALGFKPRVDLPQWFQDTIASFKVSTPHDCIVFECPRVQIDASQYVSAGYLHDAVISAAIAIERGKKFGPVSSGNIDFSQMFAAELNNVVFGAGVTGGKDLANAPPPSRTIVNFISSFGKAVGQVSQTGVPTIVRVC